MKSIKTLLLLLSILLFAGCNEESYIESVGYALEEGDETEVGYFLFYSQNVVSQCGPVIIYLDDKEVGRLTKDYNSGGVDCLTEPEEGRLIKIVTSLASHSVRVEYPGCEMEATATYNLSGKGNCVGYNLTYPIN